MLPETKKGVGSNKAQNQPKKQCQKQKIDPYCKHQMFIHVRGGKKRKKNASKNPHK